MSRKFDLQRYRNFGIMAHIDAGKTTLLKEYYIILEKIIKLVKSMMEMQQWIGWSKSRKEVLQLLPAATTCFWFRTEDGKSFEKKFGNTKMKQSLDLISLILLVTLTLR